MPKQSRGKQLKDTTTTNTLHNYVLRSSTPESEPVVEKKSDKRVTSETSIPKMADNRPVEKRVDSGKDTQQTLDVTNVEIKDLILSTSNKLTERMDSLVVTFDELKQSVEHKMETMNHRITNMEVDIGEVRKEFVQLQTSVEFTGKEVERIDKLTIDQKTIDELIERIKSLENQIHTQEFSSRKYNVLIYGVVEEAGEKVEQVVRNFFVSDLKLSDDFVKELLIANCHRLPKNPHNTYKPLAPKAIVVRLINMQDRNRILSSSRYLQKGKAVRSDLPNQMKKQRSELAHIAYDMRRKKNLQTMIRENVNGVWLEYRKDRNDRWERYKP